MAALYDGNGDRVFTLGLEDFGCHNHNQMEYDNDFNSRLTYTGGCNSDSELPSKKFETDNKFNEFVDGLMKDAYTHPSDRVYIPNNYSGDWNGQYKATSYVNDINNEYTQVLAEETASCYNPKTYTYGNGMNSAENAWEKDYYMYDGRGSVSNLTSQYGYNMVSYKYDEFGNQRESGWSNFSSFGYNGEGNDYITGLQYLRARYYDPATGRFLSQDTVQGDIMNPLTQNLYSYTLNNPLNLIDPSGHKSIWKSIGNGFKKAGKFLKGVGKNTWANMQSNVALYEAALTIAVADGPSPVADVGAGGYAAILTIGCLIKGIVDEAQGKDVAILKTIVPEKKIVFPSNPNNFKPEGLNKVEYPDYITFKFNVK